MIPEEKYQLKGITSYIAYPKGNLKSAILEEYNEIMWKDVKLVPRYGAPDERKKETKAISFYESGALKSITLENQTKIPTSLGGIDAELLTFYETGEIDSIFPRNGQIGFGWSVEDEEQLLEKVDFYTGAGKFAVKIIGLRFYENSALKSIILWPKESIELNTPIGVLPVRIGVRFYENGALESFEPAKPLSLNTKIGTIIAFDQHAIGMDADYNSVRFNSEGELSCLCTNSDIVVINDENKNRTVIYQQLKLDLMTNELVKVPTVITFEKNEIIIDNCAKKMVFNLKNSRFLFLHDGAYMEKKCSPGSDCSGCGAACM